MKNKVFLPLVLVGLVAVFSLGAYRGAVSADSHLYEMLTPTMMPAPDETLIVDDNFLNPIPVPLDPTPRYWAVLFDTVVYMPDTFCSLKAGLIATFPMGDFPECTFFVWQDNFGVPLEPPFFQTTFTTAGFPTWDYISVTPAFVASDTLPFWIGFWLPNDVDPLQQDVPACDGSPPPPGGMSFFTTDRLFWQWVPNVFMGYYDLGIRAVVSFFTVPRRDVEATQVFAPDTVNCDTMYVIEAEVYNSGEQPEDFDVILEIDTTGGSAFTDTQQVTGLFPIIYDTVSFAPWQVPKRDSINYDITVYTALAADESLANDTAYGQTFGYCFWNDDVGPLALLAPGDSVWCDSLVGVQATVYNYGDRSQTFYFKILIDSVGGNVYAESVMVSNLPPLTPTLRTFPQWQVPPADSVNYSVRLITMLAGDMDVSNDTVMDSVYSRCYVPMRDVGALSVVVPGDTVYCDTVYTPEAQVQNFGELPEDFQVEFLIDGGATYGDTSAVVGLGPGLQTNVTFTNWAVPQADSTNYGMTVNTIFPQDMNPANDGVTDSTFGVCLWFRDVGALSVVAPGDTVYCDTTYTPEAQVQNFGDLSESFAVEFLIDGGATYGDTSVVMGLGPGSQTNVTFTNWTVPLADSTNYGISVSTIFSADMNTANDSVGDSTFGICLWFRDVTPITIIWPGDTVLCNDSADVVAQVRNDGQIDETFSVEAVIETSGVAIYTDTVAVGPVIPGDTADAVFSAWVVPQLDFFAYDIAITTLLGPDAVPANDTLTGVTNGICPYHDGGVLSIDSPPDSVDVDSTYTPCATVHNYGNRTETFDAICTIDGYEDTSTVVDLMPDSSTQVCFTDWSAPAVGQYTVCVTSYVVADANALNDSLCKVIESFTGVEEVRALSPVPQRTQLFQNSPNPFFRTTSIEYAVSREDRVDLSVYDASGRLVKVLVQENALPGYYAAIWDGKDGYGNGLPSGIYFYKLVCGKTVESRKMVMVK